ncbi:MAG: hypothetical protein ACRDPC_03855 [Solirubrobacteraceae bacterium]
MKPIVPAALAAALIAAGCGGDSGPTAEERRAAMARWQQQADAACEQAEKAIVARGEPIDGVDVDRIVVRATAHLRRAAEKIRRLRTPPGGAAKVKPVLNAIDELEQPLSDLGKWSEVGKQDEVVKAAKEWRLQAVGLERAAQEAGLRVCGRDGQRHAAADAIIAPIFASQLAEFVGLLLADVKYVRRNADVTDKGTLAKYLDEFAGVVANGAARYYGMEPPMRAADESSAYHEVLLDTADFAGRAATKAKRRGYTLETLNSLERRFDRLARRERRTYRALARALRPIPGTEGEEDDPVDPEGEQET